MRTQTFHPHMQDAPVSVLNADECTAIVMAGLAKDPRYSEASGKITAAVALEELYKITQKRTAFDVRGIFIQGFDAGLKLKKELADG